MVRSLSFQKDGQTLYISCTLDAGSESNLSPELLINAICERFDLDADRSDMNIARNRLYFKDETEKNIR